jgi:hypothetical protein
MNINNVPYTMHHLDIVSPQGDAWEERLLETDGRDHLPTTEEDSISDQKSLISLL